MRDSQALPAVSKRALVVGNTSYDNFRTLTCCVDDAKAMRERLATHGNGKSNYDVLQLTSDKTAVTEAALREAVSRLFADFRGGDAVFYFSGHGVASDEGGYLVTQDARDDDKGYPMSELLEAANASGVGSVLLILDCCHSGSMGNTSSEDGSTRASLSEGVTVLAASTAAQESQEGMEYSVFTGLLLSALDGGAANVRGEVTAAAVYGYVEQSLSSWEQRPMYKSHARHLNPIRYCEPSVPDDVLLDLPKLFRAPHRPVAMDPTFEYTVEGSDPENVRKFDQFKVLRNSGLLTTEDDKDLYYVALESRNVFLTPLGQFYWRLAKAGRI